MALALLVLGGCSRPQPPAPEPSAPVPSVESGAELVLSAGRALHFADHFTGGENPEQLAVSSDGEARLVLRDARRPVLPAPAPYTIKQTLRLPDGGTLHTGFGLSPASWDKAGGGARFLIRFRTSGKTQTLLSEQVNRWQGEDSPNWLPVSIALPPSDEPVEVELVTELVGSVPEGGPERRAGSYAIWLDPTITTPAPTSRPNILLIVIDALRADHLGCYKYARNTSPHLDRLAARSLVFEDASTQATWTFPSLDSLLTSSYRFLRGQRVGQDRPDESPLQPISMPVSLQGSLREAGYETLACVGGGFLDPVLGFDAGFDWYWSPHHTPMLPDQLTVVKERLSARADRPFFLLLHTYQVHNYFQGWAHNIGDFDSGYLGPLTDPRRLMDAALHGIPSDLEPADLQYIRDLYDGEIKYTDRYLGLFLEWLRAQPGGGNTIIIVTADHGEAFGEHGEISHGGSPYREVVRVPFLVHLPDGRAGRVSDPVALADIMPTLLDLVGEKIPPSVVGRSVVPPAALRGAPVPLFAESRGASLMARDGKWWYLSWRGDKEQLYDITRDPRQTSDLAASETEVLEHMRGVLAGLATRAARGYRIEVSGPRAEPVTVEVSSPVTPGYFDVPTLRPGDSVSVGRTPARNTGPSSEGEEPERPGWRATITLAPGTAPHVLLVEPRTADVELTLSASRGAAAVPPAQVHLGETGLSPDSLPVTIGPATASLLTGEEPARRGRTGTCEIWVWRPSYASPLPSGPALDLDRLPEDLADQLRSLGYLR